MARLELMAGQDGGSTVRSGVFMWNVADSTSCAMCYFKAGLIIKGIYDVDGVYRLHAQCA